MYTIKYFYLLINNRLHSLHADTYLLLSDGLVDAPNEGVEVAQLANADARPSCGNQLLSVLVPVAVERLQLLTRFGESRFGQSHQPARLVLPGVSQFLNDLEGKFAARHGN